MATFDVVARLYADTAKFSMAMQLAGQDMENVESKTVRASRVIGAALATGFVLAPIVSFISSTTEAAAHAEETLNKVQVAFGNSADEMIQWAQNANSALLMTRSEALEAASSFYLLLNNFGIAQNEAIGMSKKLVQVAADMGSLWDVDPSEMLKHLKSGLVGEVEPLRRFGINLTRTRVKAEAFRLGLVGAVKSQAAIQRATVNVEEAYAKHSEAVATYGADSLQARDALASAAVAEEKLEKAMEGNTSAVSEAAMAQGAYSLLLKEAASAEGDVARTGGSFVNIQRQVTKQWEDMKVELGEKFLPMAIKALNWISEHMEDIKNAIFDTIEVIRSIADAFRITGEALGIFAYIVSAYVVDPIVGGVQTAIEWITVLYDKIAGIATNIISTFQSVASWFSNLFQGIWHAVTEPFKQAWNAIARFLSNIDIDVPGSEWLTGGLPITLGLPDLPTFAQGGIVTAPTIGLLGEKGPEAVIPLNQSIPVVQQVYVKVEGIPFIDSHTARILAREIEWQKATGMGSLR